MNCPKPIDIYPNNRKTVVPCQKCTACLMNKRQDWVIRLEAEHKASNGSLFVTLTYDRENMPADGKVNKRDCQLFMKRLRKKLSDRIRYYLVAEYGTRYGRPHYHILLFNTEGVNDKIIRKAWNKGLTHIGNVTQASIMYCTKYMVQPKHSDQFTLMSRAYGLGAAYLTDAMVAWHREDDRNYTINYGIKKRLPRYYKDKIWPMYTWQRHEGKAYQVENHIRKRVANKSKWQSIKAMRANMKFLKDRGYKPHQIQAEMRNALLSRVKSKTQFTQTI